MTSSEAPSALCHRSQRKRGKAILRRGRATSGTRGVWRPHSGARARRARDALSTQTASVTSTQIAEPHEQRGRIWRSSCVIGRPAYVQPSPGHRWRPASALCGHLAQGAHVKTACEAVGISEATYYDWQARGKKARDEPPPTLELTRQGLIDLLAEADVTYPARANKTELLRLLMLYREGSYMQFMHAVKRAGAVRTLESLDRIEAGAEGGALIERTTTTRTAKNGTATTTVRERFTPPDWHADGWFLERRHPADWSRRTEVVLPDNEQAAEADPLVGVHDELRLARLARQKRQGKSV